MSEATASPGKLPTWGIFHIHAIPNGGQRNKEQGMYTPAKENSTFKAQEPEVPAASLVQSQVRAGLIAA